MGRKHKSTTRQPHGQRPILVRAWWIDQVFLRRQGGRILVHISLVSHDNQLRTQKVFPPTGDPTEAIQISAREVARLGNVNDANGVRVRWANQNAASEQARLEQDAELEQVFTRAFYAALDQV